MILFFMATRGWNTELLAYDGEDGNLLVKFRINHVATVRLDEKNRKISVNNSRMELSDETWKMAINLARDLVNDSRSKTLVDKIWDTFGKQP
jgi:hypothetical protein